jgi:hypothetical protein
LEDYKQILIPEKEYVFSYECHETYYYCSSPKVKVWLRIIDESEYYGTLLYRSYNAKKLIDKPSYYGSFTVAEGSDCADEFPWVAEKPIDPNCVTLEEFNDKEILAEVRTVKTTRHKTAKHPIRHYSTIKCITGITNNAYIRGA